MTSVRTPSDPPEARPLDPRVVTIAALACLSSGAALVVTIATDRPLWLTTTFIAVPGLVAIVGLSVMARRDQQPLFLVRLRLGAVAGVLATAAYDLVRWGIERSKITHTNSFRAIRVFGSGLTDLSPHDTGALVAGWAFHALNGVGFALAFVFVAAGRHWLWGVLYALVLEAFMIWLYPGWLGFTMNGEFASVSILGHVAYGVVLGAFARRTP